MMKDDDFKLLRGFGNRQTDRQTNEWTLVVVESLLQLINSFHENMSQLATDSFPDSYRLLRKTPAKVCEFFSWLTYWGISIGVISKCRL